MKKIFLFFVVLFLISPLFAQQTIDFQYISTQLSEHPLTTGSFKQTKKINKINRELISFGNFIINADKGIAWITQEPVSSSLVVKKESMVQISFDGTKVVTNTSSNQTFSDISNTISSIFCGKYSVIEQQFSIAFSTEEQSDNLISWKTVLSPKNKTFLSFMTNIILNGVCSVSNDISETKIDSVNILESNGDTIIYEFSKQKYPKALSSAQNEIFY